MLFSLFVYFLYTVLSATSQEQTIYIYEKKMKPCTNKNPIKDMNVYKRFKEELKLLYKKLIIKAVKCNQRKLYSV